MKTMQIKATFFGKTKIVKAYPHNMAENEAPDKILWVEKGEDEYALLSSQYRDKKVAIVYRRDWLDAEE